MFYVWRTGYLKWPTKILQLCNKYGWMRIEKREIEEKIPITENKTLDGATVHLSRGELFFRNSPNTFSAPPHYPTIFLLPKNAANTEVILFIGWARIFYSKIRGTHWLENEWREGSQPLEKAIVDTSEQIIFVLSLMKSFNLCPHLL